MLTNSNGCRTRISIGIAVSSVEHTDLRYLCRQVVPTIILHSLRYSSAHRFIATYNWRSIPRALSRDIPPECTTCAGTGSTARVEHLGIGDEVYAFIGSFDGRQDRSLVIVVLRPSPPRMGYYASIHAPKTATHARECKTTTGQCDTRQRMGKGSGRWSECAWKLCPYPSTCFLYPLVSAPFRSGVGDVQHAFASCEAMLTCQRPAHSGAEELNCGGE